VYTLDCNGGSFELWTNTPLGFGDQIRDLATGRCLDSNTAGNAYTLPCNLGAFQQWTVRYTGSFGFEIQNVATGLCLDSNASGSVYTLTCNGGNFQRWL
jgi:Ricin-type beta-trefoil lectin domain